MSSAGRAGELRLGRFAAAVERAVRRGRITPSQAHVLRVLAIVRQYRIELSEVPLLRKAPDESEASS